ncbi:DUF5681 domain-containing protein [Novosphingobium sp. 9]|uniref:DUF5681 domain-containing protein n=1 Tax=Novosphingobium sp. 9 TaxID=2025349 RepID=UPI0021B5E169|nr:DUF5681 domain-containing protein [Novosphingobium sp. 9]
MSEHPASFGDDADIDDSQDTPPGPDYEVGYGKPPVHTRFKPGQSGNKGRRKKKLRETRKDIVRRIRDEKVRVNGKWITAFELAVRSTFNQTIKSGKPRDLKMLLELLSSYNAGPEDDPEPPTPEEVADAILQFFAGMPPPPEPVMPEESSSASDDICDAPQAN